MRSSQMIFQSILIVMPLMVLSACGGSDDGTPIPDQGETTATAEAISLNTSTTGQLTSGNDVDMFQIELTVPGVLSVYTTGSVDTEGALIDASSGMDVVFAFNDDYFFDDLGQIENSNFGLMDQGLAAGVYYIRVTPWSPQDTGVYTLVNTFTPN